MESRGDGVNTGPSRRRLAIPRRSVSFRPHLTSPLPLLLAVFDIGTNNRSHRASVTNVGLER